MNKFFGLIFIFTIILFSCDSSRVFEEYVTVKGEHWDRDQIAVFEVPIYDTIHPMNLYINIRNTGNYPYSNLYLFVKITAPNQSLAIDTVECILADKKGKWLGKGIGDLFEIKHLYKKGVKFAQKGNYLFSIEQAMRDEKLCCINDIGVRIEKAN